MAQNRPWGTLPTLLGRASRENRVILLSIKGTEAAGKSAQTYASRLANDLGFRVVVGSRRVGDEWRVYAYPLEQNLEAV